MKLKLFAITALITFSTASAYVAAEGSIDRNGFDLSADATLVSQYVFRGIESSQEDPALQGGVNLAHNNGLWFGIWASTYDFGRVPKGKKDDGLEIDFLVGYKMTLENDSTLDFSLTEYTYSGEAGSATELGVSWEILNYTFAYFRDIGNDSNYISADGSYPLVKDISLVGHIGNVSPDHGDNDVDFSIGVEFIPMPKLNLFATIGDHTGTNRDSFFFIGGTYTFL